MEFAPDSSILVIFCRRPMPGTGKQRVAAELGEHAAMELSELLLATTLEDAGEWSGPVVIAPAAAADAEWADDLLPAALVIPQSPGNLGERLASVDTRIRAAGGQHILYIGSDAPGLNPATLEKAAAVLRASDAVFIPARDGGVTLMGSSKPWPGLADLPWGTAQLGDALRACCERYGLSTTRFATDFDIDLRQDLIDAPALLKNDTRPARKNFVAWIHRCRLTSAGEHRNDDENHKESISIVIPVYQDLQPLEKLLTDIAAMHTGVREVIVVDGGNSEDCKSLCLLYNCRHITSGPCRGEQLRLGADNARGEILWFLHADSAPARNAPELIQEHIRRGYAGGYFRFRFQGQRRWYKQLLEWAINLRAKAGIPYGDQGLFSRRADYMQAGGFAPTPLFEEVGLVRNLRKQTRFSALNASIGVSPRRWERDGWLRRSLHNRLLALGFMLGIAPKRLVRRYRVSGESTGG